MNLRQTIQAGPAKATELIAKLANTSGQAIKTRENLFAQLKDELEHYADVEERYLLPILKKHPETKGLVPEATKANHELRRQLSELERLPKGDERFIEQIAALKKGFQQHVRDERKEILPAILKALSQEEAENVAGKIEAAATEAEEAKRNQAEKKHQDGKREREQRSAEQHAAEEAREAGRRTAESDRRVTEEASRTLRAVTDQMAETAQRSADTMADVTRSSAGTMQEATQSGMQMVTQMTKQSLEQFSRAFGLPGQETEETTRQATRNIQAVVDCSVVLANGFQNVSREWLEQAQDQLRKNLDGFNALMHARTPQDAIAAQSDLARRNLESLLEGSRRISELMVNMADQAMRRVASEAAEQFNRTHRR